MKKLNYYAGAVTLNADLKYIESAILHYDTANENQWRALSGSLDAFFERLNAAGKGVAACYQHNEDQLIGVWKDFENKDGVLSGKLYYVETPFVKDTVLPQVQAGILQGASPTIAPIKTQFKAGITDIVEGVLCEISLVGLPADMNADIIKMSAMIKAAEEDKQNFELTLLTL